MHDYHFYSPVENIDGNSISLVDSEFKHCCRVLRKNIGDQVDVFDGTGKLYVAEIVEISKNYAKCNIIKTETVDCLINLKIHLGVGLVKSKALDIIVEQAVSLGITSFNPVETEHSIKKSFNLDRYEKKALESIKQSGQLILPQINDLMSFDQWLKSIENIENKLICYQHSDYKFNDIAIENFDEIALFIGPEGGFSENEISIAKNNGFKTINLIPTRLRTELAVTTALAGIQTRR